MWHFLKSQKVRYVNCDKYCMSHGLCPLAKIAASSIQRYVLKYLSRSKNAERVMNADLSNQNLALPDSKSSGGYSILSVSSFLKWFFDSDFRLRNGQLFLERNFSIVLNLATDPNLDFWNSDDLDSGSTFPQNPQSGLKTDVAQCF